MRASTYFLPSLLLDERLQRVVAVVIFEDIFNTKAHVKILRPSSTRDHRSHAVEPRRMLCTPVMFIMLSSTHVSASGSHSLAVLHRVVQHHTFHTFLST